MEVKVRRQQTNTATGRPSGSYPGRVEPEALSPELAALLARSRNEFLRYLQYRLGNRDQAEDVLQDFHLRVVLKAGQIRDEASTTAWLRTVLKSVLADHFRHQMHERRAQQTLVAEWQTLRPDLANEPAQTPCTCFYKQLPTLKAEYAEALWRIDLAEEPREEVARALGITAGNMRVRLHRARQALRQALARSCDQCRTNGCFHEQSGPLGIGIAHSRTGHCDTSHAADDPAHGSARWREEYHA